MSVKIPLPIAAALILLALFVPPVAAQLTQGDDEIVPVQEARDRLAIRNLMREYEAAFNARDIDRRMALCLDTYFEYGFENGEFLQARNFDETRHDVGRYWENIRSLEYTMEPVETILDGPEAFVRAYTTHLSDNDRHSSIVYFSLVRLDDRWWIAWDSYNITTRFE
jgi:hypothetical protein